MHDPEIIEAAKAAFLAAAELVVATASVGDDERATYHDRVDSAARALAAALGESRTVGPFDAPAPSTPLYDALLVVLRVAG